MSTEVTPTFVGRLRTRFRTLMRERPFQLFYAHLLATLSILGSWMLYGFFLSVASASDTLRALWVSLPPELGFVAGVCFFVGGLLGCALIAAWLGFLAGDVATFLARRRPQWATPCMFLLLLLPLVLFIATWSLNKQTRQEQAIAILVVSLIMSAAVTFGFRLNGWPGPMSERPAREVWRDFREERRKRRTPS